MYVSDERGVHAGQIALFAVLSKFHTGLFCRSSILFRARSTADSVVEEADSYSRARSQPCDSADACARFETTLAEPTAVANLACCSNMITCDSRKENRHSFVLMPVLMSACAIPISMLFWTVNVAYSILWPAHSTEEHSVISPWRWLAAIVIPLMFLFWGLRRKSVDVSGAIFGLFMGFIVTLSSFAHLMALVTFFVTSSKATKFRSAQKEKLEVNFKESSQRNWIQALCNCGMATQLALLYLLDVGSGERPIDFDKEYRSSWLSIGILGAFACCNGDTWASEIGTVIGTSDPFLITTKRKVPKGTNGGVSWVGLVCSLVGGLTVGLFYYITILNTVDTAVLQLAPPQWPIVFVAAFGGLFGSILDSILGATLQYSGIDEKGKIVERPGKGVKHICGKQILDNHSVNLLSSIGTALILPRIANIFWP